jgi:CheY-like chemotaxis protein
MSDTQEPSKEEQPKVKTIFIVEDDTDIGAFLVEALQQETPYQALLARDGFQALKMVGNLKPDLFVLDYHLPSMNGLELYDQLHSTEGLKEIPAFFMSANMPLKELEQRHLDFLHKPIDLDDLLRKIEKFLAE